MRNTALLSFALGLIAAPAFTYFGNLIAGVFASLFFFSQVVVCALADAYRELRDASKLKAKLNEKGDSVVEFTYSNGDLSPAHTFFAKEEKK